MSRIAPLLPGHTYHIFNRGNNREDLFREPRNYSYFLELYQKHLNPAVETFAYCLMKNHFHLLVRLKTQQEIQDLAGFPKPARSSGDIARSSDTVAKPGGDSDVSGTSQSFSNFFNAYTKTINKGYRRTGSLFEKPFKRIEVTSEEYFINLIFYIHFNPQRHGFVDDFRGWLWSSYSELLGQLSDWLSRDYVLNWFGGVERCEAFHQGVVDERAIRHLIEEDFL